MGNAHANRQRRRPSVGHREGCLMCQMRPKEARRNKAYKNSTGHRRNPARKKRQRKKKILQLT